MGEPKQRIDEVAMEEIRRTVQVKQRRKLKARVMMRE